MRKCTTMRMEVTDNARSYATSDGVAGRGGCASPSVAVFVAPGVGSFTEGGAGGACALVADTAS